jgi:hypothetical protein
LGLLKEEEDRKKHSSSSTTLKLSNELSSVEETLKTADERGTELNAKAENQRKGSFFQDVTCIAVGKSDVCQESDIGPTIRSHFPSMEPHPSSDICDILSEFKGLIFVRYLDHVLYNRSSAMVMKPQVREAVGWLVYECEDYITLTWDRDAEPPTLKGGDPKASGLVLLKSGICEFKKLEVCGLPLQKKLYCHLNSPTTTSKPEYALRPTERKTQGKIKGEMATT